MSRCHDASLFIGAPPSLCCPIDGGVMRDAIKSTTCGHVFGMRCALDHLLDDETCPVCHVMMDCSSLAPVQHVRDAIFALKVRCPEERCDWIGAFAQLTAHVGSAECAVPRIACPFCHDVFEDGAPFEAHKPVCPEFIAICPKCECDMPRRLYPAHEASCTAVPRRIPRLSEFITAPSPIKPEPADPAAAAPSPQPEPASDAASTEVPPAAHGDDAPRADSPQTAAAKGMGVGLPPASPDGDDQLLRSLNSASSPPPVDSPQAVPKASSEPAKAESPSTTAGRPPLVPAPPPPATARSPSPNGAQAAASGARQGNTTIACAFAAFGCDPTHTGPAAAGDPCQASAVLAKHLALVCNALASLQARHDRLELQVESLKTQEIRRSRFGNNSGVFATHGTPASRLNTSTGSANTPRQTVTKSPRDATAANRSHGVPSGKPKVAPLNLGAVHQQGAPRSANASPTRDRPEGGATSARPSGSAGAAPLVRVHTHLNPLLTPNGTSAGIVGGNRHVAAGTGARPAVAPPVGSRHVGSMPPIAAWKSPPSDSPTTDPAPKQGTDAPAAGTKKTSTAAKNAARELLELRSGAAGGIVYKELVSVLPSRSPSKAVNNAGVAPVPELKSPSAERRQPRVIPPAVPGAAGAA